MTTIVNNILQLQFEEISIMICSYSENNRYYNTNCTNLIFPVPFENVNPVERI